MASGNTEVVICSWRKVADNGKPCILHGGVWILSIQWGGSETINDFYSISVSERTFWGNI